MKGMSECFSDKETSSLNFEKDDYIDVLTQLDSGWWDGWCNGSRGWFPSNYVEIVPIETRELPPQPDVPLARKPAANTLSRERSSRQGTNDSHHRSSSQTQSPRQNAPPLPRHSPANQLSNLGWSGRRNHSSDSNASSDGSLGRSFYFNQMRHELNGDSDESDYDSDEFNRRNRGSFDNSDEEDKHYKDLKPSQHLPDDYKRLSLDSLPANVESPVEAMDNSSMSQWVERVTPQGRIYFCNLSTQEATWEFEEIDQLTGRLRIEKAPLDQDTRSEPIEFMNHQPSDRAASPAADLVVEEPLSWQKLSTDIAQTVQQLNASAQRGEYERLGGNVATIVEAVRMMLYSSRSMDKDSIHMQDRVLRDPHRAVMASLSKLVLSVKMASEYSDAITPDLIHKVQKDASDLLVAVRLFVTLCQERRVVIEQVKPRLLEDIRPMAQFSLSKEDGSDGTFSPSPATSAYEPNGKQQQTVDQSVMQKAKYPLNQDLTVSLQTHANQIYGSTDALSRAAAFILSQQEKQDDDEDDEENVNGGKERSNVVLLFRSLSMKIGQYLGILEDIDLTNIDSSQILSLPEYRVNKQNLYNATGCLFGAIQLLTDVQADTATSVIGIESSIRRVEDTIESIFSSVDQMVGQRKLWLMRGGSSSEQPDSKVDSPTRSPDTVFNGADDEGGVRRYDSGTDVEDPMRARSPLHQRPSIGGNANDYKQKMVDKARKRQNGSKTADGRAGVPDNWYLGYDYAEGEIVFTKENTLKGGTLPALVERLTLHDTLDMSFIANFLLTYRSFCTSDEFLGLLEQRYNLLAPEGLTPEELETWTERKQKLVRLRVFNVMKNWLENYYTDEDEPILARLEFFTNTVIRDASSFSADQLNRLIRKRRELDANGNLKKLVPNNTASPTSIMPKNITDIKMLEIDPLELARQLSIRDFKLYSSILPIECLGQGWSRDDNDSNAATNVKQSIDYCNRLTAWATQSILTHEEPKRRVVVIKYWVQVANHCRILNNYNTCMAILSAFDNSAIGRLRKTWELVGNRTNQTLGYIRKLMGANRNFVEYREMIHSVNPPCIPFLGIYLQDLTFIEDGNPDYLKKSSNLINFAKKQKAAEVIRELKQFQTPPYTFRKIPELQEFIKTHLENSHDIEQLYERSVRLEPRNVEPTA
ncbi:ras guanine nucleotide exchange factor domain-containing protein [Phycomyces nitens]|nr:ras guanine nucleotide exchange factor domain-containing protein [Phycomyces nitens]